MWIPYPSEVPRDIASVADLWVSAAYDDLRHAGPDRAERIRWVTVDTQCLCNRMNA